MRKWISKRVIALVMTGVLSVCLITPAMAEELIIDESVDRDLLEEDSENFLGEELTELSNNSFESLEAESVSLGGFTSGAITKDGGLWMWGSNSGGQLGDESMQESTAPVFIKGNMAKVCLGDSHSAAIDKDGKLYLWGSNTFGQLGNGSTMGSSVPEELEGEYECVSLGTFHSAAIDNKGKLLAWGDNQYGRLGNGLTTSSTTPTEVKSNNKFKYVSVGDSHSAAIDEDGKLWTWGYNGDGRLGIGNTTSSSVPVEVTDLDKVKYVSLGKTRTAAITEEGELYVWGNNADGYLGDGSTENKLKPYLISGIPKVKQVSVGEHHIGAVTESGSLYMWGQNLDGELGDGSTTGRETPKLISGFDDVKEVSVGERSSGAVKNDGSLWMWGHNFFGELGTGNKTSQLRPVCINIKGRNSKRFMYYSNIIRPESGKKKSADAKDYERSFDLIYPEDGWFFTNNSKGNYNHELTKSSMCAAMAAFDFADGAETSHRKINHIVSYMNSVGLKNIKVDYFKPKYNSIGSAIGSKKITYNGEEATLILIAIRGGGYQDEWGGNFNVFDYSVTSEAHAGFYIASDEVLKRLDDYISKYSISGDIKYWVVGFSRAAATSNLVSARLIDKGNIGNTFGFCFECPQNTTYENRSDSKYDGIVSIVNPLDIVPRVAMNNGNEWKFGRYGSVYALPSPDSDADYFRNARRGYYVDGFFEKVKSFYLDKLGIKEKFPEIYDSFEAVDKEAIKLLADTVSPSTYYIAVQDILVKLMAEKMGKNSEDEYEVDESYLKEYIDKVSNGDDIGDLVKERIKKFVLHYFSTNFEQHYQELCISWLYSMTKKEITDSRYTTHYYLNCPIDVTIKDEQGNIVGQIINDIPVQIENGVTTYIDENGQKVFALPGNGRYSIIYKATDDGEMTCSLEEIREGYDTVQRVISYSDIEVSKGDIFEGEKGLVEENKRTDYGMKDNTDDEIKPSVDQKDDEIVYYSVEVSTEGRGVASGRGVFTYGQFDKLTATPDDGESFVGWEVDGKFVSGEPEYRIEVKKDTSVKGIFTDKESTNCYLGFDTQGGNYVEPIKNIEKGTSVKLPDDPVNGDYIFGGWYTEQNGNGKRFTDKVTVDKSMTLYAFWTREGMRIEGLNNNGYGYTGLAIKPEIRVYDEAICLKEKTDYTISYKNNKNVYTLSEGDSGFDPKKAPSITVTGKGNYDSKEVVYFKILPQDISGAEFSADDITLAGTDKAQKVASALYWKDKALKNKKDYTFAVYKASDTGFTDPLGDSVKEPGEYVVRLTGTGNFTETRDIDLTVTSDYKLVKTLKIGKVSAQKYTGSAIMPEPEVRDGNTVLTKDEHYTLSYASNTDPGTGYVIVKGIPEKGYAGTRRIGFKITAPKGSKASAYDISEAKDTEHRITVTCDSPAAFMKGGAKPAVTVTYTDKEGSVRTLTEGRDYKLSFRNNTSLSGGKSPAAVVAGMGDFKGKRECTFAISEKSLDKVTLLADDVAFKNKANSFATKLTLTDEDEKVLKAGKDYEKIPEYTYVNDTEVTSGGSAVTRTAGEKVDKTDIIPVDTVIMVTVKAIEGSGYTGTVSGEYKITKAGIASAKVSIPVQTYTGKPINLNKSDIKVSIKGTTLGEDDYDIVSYSNNTQKGTAKVTLRGKGNYGGLKTQTFKIKAKGFKWWWRK